MRRQVRHRVTALVLGGLLLGAPLLTNGTANAEQTEGGGRQVVFAGGGVLGLSCRSTPDAVALTVPADTTIRLVNRTGHDAALRLGAETKGSIADDSSTEVVFRRGTTAVSLHPECALGTESVPVLVTATPSAPPASSDPGPTPAPGDGGETAQPDDSGTPSEPAGSPTDSTGPAPTTPSGTTPDTPGKPSTSRPHSPSGRPQQTVPEDTTPQTPETLLPALPPVGGGLTPGGAPLSPADPGTPGSRGTSAAVPAFAGMPPGEDRVLLPGVPTLEVTPQTATVPGVAGAEPPTYVAAAAAEPVRAMQPLDETGPVGLLALVATVCVMGVASAAIRAFVSERASRAGIA